MPQVLGRNILYYTLFCSVCYMLSDTNRTYLQILNKIKLNTKNKYPKYDYKTRKSSYKFFVIGDVKTSPFYFS